MENLLSKTREPFASEIISEQLRIIKKEISVLNEVEQKLMEVITFLEKEKLEIGIFFENE